MGMTEFDMYIKVVQVRQRVKVSRVPGEAVPWRQDRIERGSGVGPAWLPEIRATTSAIVFGTWVLRFQLAIEGATGKRFEPGAILRGSASSRGTPSMPNALKCMTNDFRTNSSTR
jgi:hypothetical protein